MKKTLKKSLAALLASATLMTGFNAQAQCLREDLESPPSTPTTELTGRDSPAFSAERATDLKDTLKKSSAGKETLHILDMLGIRIALATPEQLGDTNPNDDLTLVGRTMGKIIALNGAYDDNDLLPTLAHEGRHIWQNRALGLNENNMNPAAGMIINRYKEADAFAYEFYFAYKHEKETGEKLIAGQETPYEKTYALFKLDMDSGMPLPIAYKYLMRRSFDLVRDIGYDEGYLAKLEDDWSCSPAKAAERARLNIKLPVAETSYPDSLRDLGAPNYNIGTLEGVFAARPTADLTNWDKIGGIRAEDLKKLNDFEKKYQDAIKKDAPKPPTPQL